MTTHESIVAILDAKNEKLQARVWELEAENAIAELEAEIEKVRESIGIVQAENVRLRDLLAEVIACDETNGWTPFVLDQNNLLDTTSRNVTLPVKLIERAKELLLRAAGGS